MSTTMEDNSLIEMEQALPEDLMEEEEEVVDIIAEEDRVAEQEDFATIPVPTISPARSINLSEEGVEELIPSIPPISTPIASNLVDDSTERVVNQVNQQNGEDDGGKSEVNRVEIDVCPICFQAWTSGGDHRICCLPCGHVYGMSCIKRWILQCQSSGKCPQCKSLCTLKDIRVLYVTRLCVADEIPHKASAVDFPFTKEGFIGFQQYVTSCLDALRQHLDSLERRSEENGSRLDVLEQRCNELMERIRDNHQ